MVLAYNYGRRYLFAALESTPFLLRRTLKDLSDQEADRRPDPDRFSIREAVAHLAEWEPIFLNRMERILGEDLPLLEGYDEGELAVQNDYASKNVAQELSAFSKGRERMVAFLKDRNPEDWDREGDRPEIGRITLADLTLMIPLHDLYHLKQISDWRSI